MGAGKSTIGRQLAKALRKKFYDSDREIEQRTGVSISWIFEMEGESGFRERESKTIEDLTALDNVVLATGGGAVLSEENRNWLRARGHVIYLSASMEQLYRRTSRDKKRPLLQTGDRRKQIENLLIQRDPLYREVADIIVKTGEQSVQHTVNEVIKKLKKNRKDHRNIMKTLEVSLAERSYPIYIGQNLLSQSQLLQKHIKAKEVLIVTNETIAPLYLKQLEKSLTGYRYQSVILPDGEAFKNLDVMNQIFDALLKSRFSRQVTLIALGGGVIGDMAGFAAACYQRGVPFIQIPTTLLSQVDSSVGGKTAVNHALGKNMIGAFYQPQCVLADTNTLNTLEDRQLSSGLAEVIKYGLINDAIFFEWLEKNISALKNRDPAALAYAIERSCHDKADLVAKDETEKGVRALLNLGHTFGHAIETGMGYGNWLHGEAIAVGMLMAADLSARQGWIEPSDVKRIRDLFEIAGLPVTGPNDMGPEQYLSLMSVDKKVQNGVIRLILMKGIGQAVITDDYDRNKLQETLSQFQA